MKKSLYIFRRDFRTSDNVAFRECLNNSDQVGCVFFLRKNVEQDWLFNPFSFSFLIEGLLDLKNKIPNLNIIETEDEIDELDSIKLKFNFDSIYENYDYTEFAKHRSQKIADWASLQNVKYYHQNFHDYLLFDPGSIRSEANMPYQKFTSFYNAALKKIQINSLTKPVSLKIEDYSEVSFIKFVQPNNISDEKLRTKIAKKLDIRPERKSAIAILKNLSHFDNYTSNRDFLTYETTDLAAYLKFGLVSVREVFAAIVQTLGLTSSLARQIIWREFWYHFHILVWNKSFGEPFQKSYDNYWSNHDNSKEFIEWKQAATNIPIIDAAINQLNTTGRMHNRARMIVASYLTKNLDVHWQHGEHHFARHLIDYDPIVNHWSWQWSAGCGTDAAQYSRIFNPQLQAQKFDSQNQYINKWNPYPTPNEELIDAKLSSQRKKAILKYQNLIKTKT